MFGPLPLLHKVVLVAITLLGGVIAGAWVAHMTPFPLAVSVGALAGGVLGLVTSYAVIHQPQPRTIRIQRRR
jgi:outer membrane lipoprotein SlyB